MQQLFSVFTLIERIATNSKAERFTQTHCEVKLSKFCFIVACLHVTALRFSNGITDGV